MSIKRELESIPREIKSLILTRLNEFNSFKDKSSEDWFSELCFCILTSNSKQKTAAKIQNELGYSGFASLPQEKIVDAIVRNKHRFHNVKAARIVEARKHLNIKSTIQSIVKENGEASARDWLVKNVKGLGYKESSHFLRNTGHTQLAILDRHILRVMHAHGLIDETKTLTPSRYLSIEQKFNSLAKELNMNSAHLDLAMWYLKTREVLK